MSGVEKDKSALILGMKRSGTNWVESTLAPLYDAAVSEPLGLHNDKDPQNPLNPWNYSSRDQVSEEFGHTELRDKPYQSLLTRSFIEWVNEGDKLVKETDFLYADWLLKSAQFKTLVVSRDPRASIASYRRWGLYDDWDFNQRLAQFQTTVESTPGLASLYDGLFDKSGKLSPIRKLAVYYAIGISEIARATHDQDVIKARYEELVNDPLISFREIIELLGLPYTPETERLIIEKTTKSRGNSPYSTYRSREHLLPFMEILSSREEADIRAVMKEAGIDLEPVEGSNIRIMPSPKDKADTLPVWEVSRTQAVMKTRNEAVQTSAELYTSPTLTTNEEYAQFLDWLIENNFPLSIGGVPLFYNDRSEGKIRQEEDEILIEAGSEEKPVNFVNWIGASLYADWCGGRLPTTDEWYNYFYNENSEIDYTLHDVKAGKPDEKGIYDSSTHQAIWLRDGVGPHARNRAGRPWNHPTDLPIIPTPRPYWLGTSGLGIRVVFNKDQASLGENEFKTKIKDIIDFLTNNSHYSTAEQNEKLFQMINNI